MKDKINITETIKNMTIKEKAMFLSGSSPMNNYPVERLNIPKLNMNDGPNGLRRISNEGDSMGGISFAYKSTVFPCGAMLASTWNKDLIYEVGEAIGKECNYYGTNVLIGPAVNIKRNPLCGRNFEYYSEDPYLSGTIASCFINGLQKRHVAACVKHFACNNNEKFRFIGNVKIDKRALREIYLKPYEIILKNTNVYSFMNAYNRVNDEYCSQNSFLLDGFLRKENHFSGVIMTDWGAIVDRVQGLKAGTDLEMPCESVHNINYLIESVTKDEEVLKALDKSVSRMLDLYNKTLYEVNENEKDENIFDNNYFKALETAEEGIVLLKNENNVLPLNKEERILFVGDMIINPRFQGSGSSLLNPYKLFSFLEILKRENPNYKFVRGYDQFEDKNESYLNELQEYLKKDNKFDKCVVFAGQSDYVESEGFDRETLKLPEIQLKVIKELKKLNLPLIVVFASGSVIELPFKDDVDAILDTFLGGEAVSEATYNVLYGKVSPSGKLTESFINKYEDVLFGEEFSKDVISYYKESIYVGYRNYDTNKISVAYPFGYGLTYSKFDYSSLKVEVKNNEVVLTFDIKNIGNFKAKEIAEIYVGKNDSSLYRPLKELKAFEKVDLDIGGTKKVSLSINFDDLKVFDPINKKRVLEDGKYQIYVGKNVSEIALQDEVFITAEKIDKSAVLQGISEKFKDIKGISSKEYCSLFNLNYIENKPYSKPYTMETPIYAFNSFMGKIFRCAVLSVGNNQVKKAKKIADPIEKNRQMKAGVFVQKLMPVNTLRSLSFSSSGSLPFNIAKGLLEMINGHYFKGFKIIMKKEKIK